MLFNEINSELFIGAYFKTHIRRLEMVDSAVGKLNVRHRKPSLETLLSEIETEFGFRSAEFSTKSLEATEISSSRFSFLSCLEDIQFILFKTFFSQCR